MKTRTLFAVLLVAACNDGATAPQLGSLTVSASTSGGDLDTDGYRLIVGTDRQLAIGSQNTLVLNDINAGAHVLSLDGVAPNCSAEPASVTVEVLPGTTASAAFIVTCMLTGIEVTTRTSGVDQPPGYTVRSGERTGSVRANGSLALTRLSAGNHSVMLAVNDNCSVAGGNVANVAVSNRAITRVNFDIMCARTEKSITFVRDTLFNDPFPKAASSILVAAANGSSIVPLADGHGPAWSPDGKRVAFSETTCDFYYYTECQGGLVMIDPEARTASIVDRGGGGFDPSWSPDGQALAFTRAIGSFIQISLLIVAPLDGAPGVAINPLGVNAAEPSWSPDGRRIAFKCSLPATVGPAASDICVVNRDGTGFVRLTNDLVDDGSPAWSPDGTRIAFRTWRFFTSSISSIGLMAADGTGITWLTNGFDPAWSPDGSKLVFAGDKGLFTINADGSNVTRLTTGQHRAPDWRK